MASASQSLALTKQAILKPEGPFAKSLSNLTAQKVRGEIDRESTIVYAKLRRNNLYYRGFQYLTMVRGQDGRAIDYQPVTSGGMTPFSGNDRERNLLYDNTLPLFRGDIRKFCGVLGVRSPNAGCSPRTVGDDQQIRLSRIGDRAISYLRSTWQADAMQRYLSYSLAVNGTTFGYVNFVADSARYGETEIPRLEIVEVPAGEPYFQCWKCGTENEVSQVQQTGRCVQCEAELGPEDYRAPDTVPSVVQTSVDRYANGAVEMQIATGVTVKTPYYIPSDMDQTPWVWYSYLANRYQLIRSYCPKPADDDKSPEANFRRELRASLLEDKTSDPSGASNAEVRRTINTLSSPSGSPFERKSLASYDQYFLSPAMIEAIPDDESGNLREQLAAKYTKGMHLIYISGKLADIRHVAIGERWSVCQPDTGDYIWRDAIFEDYIQGQDVINDCLNLLIQQAEKSNPLTIFDPDVVDPDYLRDRSVQTGEMLEAKKGVGSQLATSFFKIPGVDMNDALMKFIEFYIKYNRQNVGILDALFGGGQADEAVGVAKIRRNQSLMQLNIPWNYMRDFWASLYTNGIRLLAEYSGGKLVTAKGGSVEVEELDGIQDLLMGGFKVECEEAMPMTWAQRQEQVESMLQRPPQAWTLMGLSDANGNANPANVEQIQEAVGMPDWVVPGLNARERLLDIIHQLLQSEPTDGQPDPQSGQPGPPQPSVQPNQTMFDAPMAVQVCRDWLVSDKGREAEGGQIPGQSPRGFENVLAYTQAWMNLSAPPPAPPEQPKVSVSVKPTDFLVPGVSEVMAKDFQIGSGEPPPPGTELPPPMPAPPMGAPSGGPPSPAPAPPDQRMPPPPPGHLNGAPPPGGMPIGPAPGGLQ